MFSNPIIKSSLETILISGQKGLIFIDLNFLCNHFKGSQVSCASVIKIQTYYHVAHHDEPKPSSYCMGPSTNGTSTKATRSRDAFAVFHNKASLTEFSPSLHGILTFYFWTNSKLATFSYQNKLETQSFRM